MPALAGAPRKIAPSGPLVLSRPQWSSDGARLACVVAPPDDANRVRVDVVSLGSDGHAAQGDGEVTGTAIETSLATTLQVTLHKKMPLR